MYVRNPDDAARVLAVLRERQPDVPTLPVYAELSRPTLLVEIDSAAHVATAVLKASHQGARKDP